MKSQGIIGVERKQYLHRLQLHKSRKMRKTSGYVKLP